MNRLVLAAVLCGLAATAVPAAAQEQQQQQAYTAPTAAPNEYTDPAMTFIAPDGYVKGTVNAPSVTQFDQPTIVSAFAGNRKDTAGRIITITMDSFDGTLDGWEMRQENDLRNHVDSVFIKNKKLTTLANGMPAYWEEITVGSGFGEMKRYEYCWIDRVRGVILAVTAPFGTMTEDQAKKALANASATAYPTNNY
jgi:hypothetical protein